MDENQLEEIIQQTINGAIATIPMHLKEIEDNKKEFKVDNSKEFVYGMIMGMALGIGSAVITAETGTPSEEDQLKVRDIVYKNIPEIRDRIFS